MPSLITMAVYDTVENERTWMTKATLQTLRDTVNFTRHQLMVSDNGSCEETHALYKEYDDIITFISYNRKNLGTAKALNKLWRHKQPYHKCVVKIDNDVVIHRPGWLDLMELVFERCKDVGICGLKRRDLQEWPIRTYMDGSRWWLSKLRAVPHKMGEPWLIIEECMHVMGTCQAYRGELVGFDTKFGFLWQPRLYGLDDSFAAYRMGLLGYRSVFLHEGVPIDHIDPGGTEFVEWKKREAGKVIGTGQFDEIKREYKSGERSVYYDGGFDDE